MRDTTFIDSRKPLALESRHSLGVLLPIALTPRGDRADDAQDVDRAARMVADDVSGPNAGQHHTVGPLHTMCEGDVRTEWIPHLIGGLCHAGAIIGMHQRKKSTLCLMPRNGRHAEEFVDLR